MSIKRKIIYWRIESQLRTRFQLFFSTTRGLNTDDPSKFSVSRYYPVQFSNFLFSIQFISMYSVYVTIWYARTHAKRVSYLIDGYFRFQGQYNNTHCQIKSVHIHTHQLIQSNFVDIISKKTILRATHNLKMDNGQWSYVTIENEWETERRKAKEKSEKEKLSKVQCSI